MLKNAHAELNLEADFFILSWKEFDYGKFVFGLIETTGEGI